MSFFRNLNIKKRLVLAFAISALLITVLSSLSIITISSLSSNLSESSKVIQTNIEGNVSSLAVNQSISDLTSQILSSDTPERLSAIDPGSKIKKLKRENKESDFDWSIEKTINDFYITKQEFITSGNELANELASLISSSEKLQSNMSKLLSEVNSKNISNAQDKQDEISEKTQEQNDKTLKDVSSNVTTTLNDVVLVLQIRSKLLEIELTVADYISNRSDTKKNKVEKELKELDDMLENIPENVAGPFEIMAFSGLNEEARNIMLGESGIANAVTIDKTNVDKLNSTFKELDEKLQELAENTVFDGSTALEDYISNVSVSLAKSLSELITTQEGLNKTFNSARNLDSIVSNINDSIFKLSFLAQRVAIEKSTSSLSTLKSESKKILETISEKKNQFVEILNSMGYTEQANEMAAQLDQLTLSIDGKNGILVKASNGVEAYTNAVAANNMIEKSLANVSNKMTSSFANLSESTAQKMNEEVENGENKKTTILWVGIITILTSLGIGLFMGQRISRSLAHVVENLFHVAERLTNSSASISQSSAEQATMSSEQAASLEESSSTIEEISSMAAKNAGAAKEASTISSEVQTAAIDGTDKMNAMNNAMDELNKASEQIGHIIRTIDEIAFQTNILALNAAVEAARAGEAGAGFAVVAEEVRNLAMKSKKAAQETEEIIARNTELTKEGVDICGNVGESLGTIKERIDKLDSLIAGIAQATQEQSTGLEQINKGIQETSVTTQKNAALAQQGAAASQDLSMESKNLLDNVENLSLLSGTQTDNSQGLLSETEPIETSMEPSFINDTFSSTESGFASNEENESERFLT